MAHKEVANLRQRIRDAGVSLDDTDGPDARKRLAAELGKVEFETRSSDGSVRVFMGANGDLNDVILPTGFLDKHDREQAAGMLRDTIYRAEQTMREAIASMREVRQ